MNMILQDYHYIGSFSIIQIDRNTTYKDGDFERHQEEQRQKVVQEFKSTHLKVKPQVGQMSEIFQECSDDVG
eukprot:14591562-Ditylum_brightwellii.AAC.1